jgi:hypothetical protein
VLADGSVPRQDVIVALPSSKWERGDEIVQREVVDGTVHSAVPVRVWQDDDILAIYRTRGSVCLWPGHPKGQRRPADEYLLRHESWDHGLDGIITLVEPGAEYSVSLLRHGDGAFSCWYVDFIEPYQRTPLGFDFRDLHLDLIKLADGTVYLKDEEEFEQSVALGELSFEQAAAVRDVASAVQRDAFAGSGLFAADWLDWQPPPEWRRRLAIADEICESARTNPLRCDFNPSRSVWLRS